METDKMPRKRTTATVQNTKQYFKIKTQTHSLSLYVSWKEIFPELTPNVSLSLKKILYFSGQLNMVRELCGVGGDRTVRIRGAKH